MPVLFDDEMHLIEPACEWLLSVALVEGRTRSPETWRTYGEALFDWFQTLEANAWDWAHVSPEQVAGYRDKMTQFPSNLTRRPCSVRTANLRLGTLKRFYRWASHVKNVRSPFMGSLNHAQHRDRTADLLAHTRSRDIDRATQLALREPRRIPRAIDQRSLRAILLSLSVRDRLLAEWSLETGMRRMEIAALQTGDLSSRRVATDQPSMPLMITKTKGGKPRRIYVPTPLVHRTVSYLREERAYIAKRTSSTSSALFLTNRGTALSKESITSSFARACNGASVQAHFHELRHTFAVMMLRALQRQTAAHPQMNPLLVLKVLMGHSSIRTTEIYLEVLLDELMAVEDAIAAEVAIA